MNTNLIPITDIMTKATITASATALPEEVAALMIDHHISCVPIVDSEGRPIGIITKLDLIESPGRKTARELMMPHAMSLTIRDTLANAATLMTHEGFHHVLVLDDHKHLVGVVSTFDITRWVATISASVSG
ncbi:MAG: CBS domain-containing protein [Kofleriaceae bacterium]